ncbi:hypothetical protein CCR75_005822 [Bremia lactucae]|uniref:Uncharacterized protein n=1 Tax=Bremia lactucae TaxID=4779 RepID=A0A976FMW2_BRELC|nr:hypothetical protein CCR75_005822 [Bremia lactucae]
MSKLAPRVFLALDDLSRAGKHVIQFAKINGAGPHSVPQTIAETLLPPHLSPYVRLYQWPNYEAVAIIVATNEMQVSQYWELADALVSVLSEADVQWLTIVAALHLSYAKHDGLSVFYSNLNGAEDQEVDVTVLPRADPSWEVKDPWLSAFLRLIKLEQWPRTHLLLAKGYKPGRDMSSTYEAVDALSQALQLVMKGRVIVDPHEVQQELPRLLKKEQMGRPTGIEHLARLYQ